MVATGGIPVFSARIPPEELARLDKVAGWLYETRGFKKSRGVAITYLLDYFLDQNGEISKDSS